MPVNPQDRPLNQVREEVIDQLIMNYGHDKLSLEAFETRLDKAMEADNADALLELTADLDLAVDQDFVTLKKEQMSSSPEYREAPIYHSEQEVDTIVQILGSSDRTGQWHVAKELQVYNVLGGGDLDFSEAIFVNKVTRVKIYSFLGSNDIFVPENINVTTNAFCILGSVKNQAPSTDSVNAPTLIIEGYSVLSSIEIKIRRTLKERFIRFADGIKSLLR